MDKFNLENEFGVIQFEETNVGFRVTIIHPNEKITLLGFDLRDTLNKLETVHLKFTSRMSFVLGDR